MAGEVHLVEAEFLRRLCARLFESIGVPEEEAIVIADNLVDADLKGNESHGVSRVGIYLKRLRLKLVKPVARLEVIAESPGTALCDACNSMGAVGASKAMELAIKKARQSGMSFVTVRNSNHYSAASYFAQMALPHGMIGFTASNGPPRMAPWGGTDPHFGTDPFAVAIPAGRQLPIIADMATCVVARGKIIMAAKKGEPIPLGWARNADGEDTADANEALAGTVLPFAGPKGYAIATVIEVLTGILSGSRFTRGINDMYANFENPSFTSHYFGALNVEAFSSLAEFAESMDRFIVGVKANTLAKGAREIYLPGEIELRLKEARLKNGIPVSPIVFSELREEAETAGVAWNLD